MGLRFQKTDKMEKVGEQFQLLSKNQEILNYKIISCHQVLDENRRPKRNEYLMALKFLKKVKKEQ